MFSIILDKSNMKRIFSILKITFWMQHIIKGILKFVLTFFLHTNNVHIFENVLH